MRPKPSHVETPAPEAQTQSSSTVPSGEVSSGSAAGEKAAADKLDANKAAASTQSATESLSVQAMNKKGDDAYYGRGVAEDYKQAVRWYRKAAEAGNAEGMYNLGGMYLYGRSRAGLQAGPHWYRKAAEAGSASGMNNLGLMYQNGTESRKTTTKPSVGIAKPRRRAARMG